MSIIKCDKGLLFDNKGEPIPVTKWDGASIGVQYPNVVVSVVAPEEVTSGDNFTVRLDVDGLSDFGAFQVDLVYDPDVFKVMGIFHGLICTTHVNIDMWGFIPPGTQGRARTLGNVAGVPGVSGSGYLAEITFHAK